MIQLAPTPEQRILATGDFRVDDLGRVWRVRSRGEACEPRRAEWPSPDGYLLVRRWIDGGRIRASAHRIVWTHAHGPIPAGLYVHHLNGLKDDNRPGNLGLVTPSENAAAAHRDGLRDQYGEKNPHAKLTDREVAQIRLAYASGHYSQRELGRRFGVAQSTVSAIVRGIRRPKQGGPVVSGGLEVRRATA